MGKPIRKAVIAAAGFGTRFLPQTKAMPKEMLPIVDKPIIQYVVEELASAGIEDIIIVTGYSKRSIEDHFDYINADLRANLKKGGKLELLEETKKIGDLANFIYVRMKGIYGSGTPLLNVEHLIGDEPFIYTWGDDFMVADPGRSEQLINYYEKLQAPIMASIRARSDQDYERYGFAAGVEVEPGIMKMDDFIEKPGAGKAPSDVATVSGYVLTPEIFSYLVRARDNLPEGREFYFQDALNLMLQENKPVYACDIKGGKFYDTGNKLEYLKTVVDFALKHEDIKDDFADYLRGLTL